MEEKEKNAIFDIAKNKLFFGNIDKLHDWNEGKISQAKIIEKVKMTLKNYMELDNVSFLFGSGTSIHLGAVSIRNFPIEVEKYILGRERGDAFYSMIKKLQKEQLKDKEEDSTFKDKKGWEFIIKESIIRDSLSGEIATEYESVLNYLTATEFLQSLTNMAEEAKQTRELISTIKEGLFEVCNVDKRKIPISELRRIIKRGKKNAFKSALKTNIIFINYS